jgi:hypothetical protein
VGWASDAVDRCRRVTLAGRADRQVEVDSGGDAVGEGGSAKRAPANRGDGQLEAEGDRGQQAASANVAGPSTMPVGDESVRGRARVRDGYCTPDECRREGAKGGACRQVEPTSPLLFSLHDLSLRGGRVAPLSPTATASCSIADPVLPPLVGRRSLHP